MALLPNGSVIISYRSALDSSATFLSNYLVNGLNVPAASIVKLGDLPANFNRHQSITRCCVFIALIDNEYFSDAESNNCIFEIHNAIGRRVKKYSRFPLIVPVLMANFNPSSLPNIGGILKSFQSVLHVTNTFVDVDPNAKATAATILKVIEPIVLSSARLPIAALTSQQVANVLYCFELAQYSQRFLASGVCGIHLSVWPANPPRQLAPVPTMAPHHAERLKNVIHRFSFSGVPRAYYEPDILDARVVSFDEDFRHNEDIPVVVRYTVRVHNARTGKITLFQARHSDFVAWSNRLLRRLPQLQEVAFDCPFLELTQDEKYRPGLLRRVINFWEETRPPLLESFVRRVSRNIEAYVLGNSWKEGRRQKLNRLVQSVVRYVSNTFLVEYLFRELKDGCTLPSINYLFVSLPSIYYPIVLPLLIAIRRNPRYHVILILYVLPNHNCLIVMAFI